MRPIGHPHSQPAQYHPHVDQILCCVVVVVVAVVLLVVVLLFIHVVVVGWQVKKEKREFVEEVIV
jgi:hypothetical protein